MNIDSAEDWNAKIRALVSHFELSYYFNPGGVEFFSCAHPNIPHCQISEYSEREDFEKLSAWTVKNQAELTAPEPDNYAWYSEGECGRVINGKRFVPMTLTMTHDDVNGISAEHIYEICDLEQLDNGWRLIERSGKDLTITSDDPNTLTGWEKALFRDS